MATCRFKPKPVMILTGAAVMMSIGMGMRQSLGLFLPPITHDLAIKAADPHLCPLPVQNIAWGLSANAGRSDRRQMGAAPGDALLGGVTFM